MRLKVRFIFLMIILLGVSVTTWGQDYFWLDFETGTIKIDSDDPSVFAPMIDGGSGMVISHHASGQNILLYLPFTGNEQGKLLVTDRAGKVVKSFELGYGEFAKAASADGGQVLVSYRKQPKSGQCELALLDVGKNEYKTFIVDELTDIYDIRFMEDGVAMILGLNKAKNHVLCAFDAKHPKIQPRIDLGAVPVPADDSSTFPNRSKLFIFNSAKAAIVSYGIPGTVSIVNLTQSTVENRLDMSGETFSQWFPKTKRLIVADRTIIGSTSQNTWSGRGRFIKIDGKEFKTADVDNWWQYQYLEKSDRLVYLLNDKIGVIDFGNGKTREWSSGDNYCTEVVSNWIPTHPSQMSVAEEKNTAFCWNPMSGKITVVDLGREKVIAKLQGIRYSGKELENKDGRTLIGYALEKPLIYVLRDNRQIRILNDQFVQVSSFKFNENILGMYQLDLGASATLVVTKQKIYKIEGDQLTPIYEFKEKITRAYLLKDGNHYTLVSDREWAQVDAGTLAVTPVKQLNAPLDDRIRPVYGHNREKLMHVPN